VKLARVVIGAGLLFEVWASGASADKLARQRAGSGHSECKRLLTTVDFEVMAQNR
jgi:hypothetical protein